MRLFCTETNTASAPPEAALRRPGAQWSIIAALAITAVFASTPGYAQLNQALQAQQEVDRAAAQAQTQLDDIRDRTLDAAGRYAQAMTEAESYEKYNEQLSAQVQSQVEEISSIQRQLGDIETTNREIQPLMDKMVNALDQFVSLDVPFLVEERRARVDNLKNNMTRSDVTISEKYRLIIEAYQIELEYGRTLEAYEGVLNLGDSRRTVEFVRLGRISLMYRTLDGSETGYWDAGRKEWVVDNSYAEAIEQAIRVANQDGAPELLTVPVPAPQEVQS
jgi:hypothetical protein